MRRKSPLRGILIYGGAALLAFFWFAPFVVVFMGSVIQEVNLISFPPRWFKDPPSFAMYDYIFTGQLQVGDRVGGTLLRHDEDALVELARLRRSAQVRC